MDPREDGGGESDNLGFLAFAVTCSSSLVVEFGETGDMTDPLDGRIFLAPS